ncbi:hypothetical protein SCALM49S_04761 [Streptomyces californicus]
MRWASAAFSPAGPSPHTSPAANRMSGLSPPVPVEAAGAALWLPYAKSPCRRTCPPASAPTIDGRVRSRPARNAAAPKTPRKATSRVHAGTAVRAANACPAADSTTQTAVNTAALMSRRPAPAHARGVDMAGTSSHCVPRARTAGPEDQNPSATVLVAPVRGGCTGRGRTSGHRYAPPMTCDWPGLYTGRSIIRIRRTRALPPDSCLRSAECGNTYRYVEPQPGGWKMSIWWSLHLRREAASVPLARRFLLGTMETAGVDPDVSFDLSVALSEACANAVEHGGHRAVLGEPGTPGTDALPPIPGSTGSRPIWTARSAVSRSVTPGRASPPGARFAQPHRPRTPRPRPRAAGAST